MRLGLTALAARRLKEGIDGEDKGRDVCVYACAPLPALVLRILEQRGREGNAFCGAGCTHMSLALTCLPAGAPPLCQASL
jgi:hypothetical protein